MKCLSDYVNIWLNYTLHITIDEDTAKATALQCRLALSITLHDCSLGSKYC